MKSVKTNGVDQGCPTCGAMLMQIFQLYFYNCVAAFLKLCFARPYFFKDHYVVKTKIKKIRVRFKVKIFLRPADYN